MNHVDSCLTPEDYRESVGLRVAHTAFERWFELNSAHKAVVCDHGVDSEQAKAAKAEADAAWKEVEG